MPHNRDAATMRSRCSYYAVTMQPQYGDGAAGRSQRFFPVSVTTGMIISSIDMPPCWNVSL